MEERWEAWGICVNPDCPDHYVGDMTYRRDDEGVIYAVCPICDIEIADDDMPESADARMKLLGW